VARGGWVARLFSGQARAETADTGGFSRAGGCARSRSCARSTGRRRWASPAGVRGLETPALYDPDRLARAAGSPAWRAAVMDRAEEALARPPFSILDKTTLPPSGDPHDYWHPAPYWWPDPRKADGLPYVKKDGERVPGTRLFEPGHEAYDRTRLQWLFEDTTHLAMAHGGPRGRRGSGTGRSRTCGHGSAIPRRG
jgi:hypothetical protein